ncbi:unnamed protein product [Larinioides sclopetarius]|uniref:Uncharacterized protein n=1 Tax=Larinioides sclopetarius TaxID=280406 RepID=A0AAV1ZNA9_9ARAC
MDNETKMDFSEKAETSSVSRNEISEEGITKTEISEHRNSSSDFSNMETVSFISTVAANGSSECVIVEDIGSELVIVKTDSTDTEKLGSLKSVLELTESKTKVKELRESIELQTEETEEMLEMISSSKKKLEFFLLHVEYFVKFLKELKNYSATHSKMGNTYLKNIYRKKLEEFASDLLDKIKKSIKDLEVDYEILKERERKIETFEKNFEFGRISDSCTAETCNETFEQLKETVDHLAKDMCLLKPKQLFEIEKVSYIETDIEMLHDLHRRFSSIECPNLNSSNLSH